LDRVLDVGSIVQFNGSTLKTEDGTEIKLSEASAIAGAIKIGWLVQASSVENTFTPKSAGIQVHSAKSSGEKRQTVNVMTVHDEEQNMGNRKEVRQNSSGERKASTSRNSEEGVVVSRLKTPAKAPPVEMGTNHQAVLRQLETEPLAVERLRLAKPSGDVAEALAGDEIEDILPEAATARPPKRAYANDGVVTSSGGSSVGGQEDGVVIGKVGVRPNAAPKFALEVQEDDEEETLLPEDPTFREKALRRWAQTGKTWNGQPVSLRDLSLLALTVLEALEATRSEKAASPSSTRLATKSSPHTPDAELVAKLPTQDGVDWDLTAHWKTRKASLQQYKSDSGALAKIYAIENSGGVKKTIEAMLQDLGESLS
jgi:hypothetical protein